MHPSDDTSVYPSSIPSYLTSVNPYRAPSEKQVGALQEEIWTKIEQVKPWKILLRQEILSMPSVYFTIDKLISLLCPMFSPSQVHSGSKPICFSSALFCNFVLSHFWSALNCDVVSCVTSIFCIFKVSSLSRLYIQYRKMQREKYNMKNTAQKNTTRKIALTINLTLTLTIFLQVYFYQWSNDFLLWKIQHKNTTCTNKFIQHDDTTSIPRSNAAWSLYNTLIQHTFFSKMLTSSKTCFDFSFF